MSVQVCNVCLCPIRQLIIVLQPCGHYYCDKCTAAIRAVSNARCPECRSRIGSTFRVPLSSSQSQRNHEDVQYAKVGFLLVLCIVWQLCLDGAPSAVTNNCKHCAEYNSGLQILCMLQQLCSTTDLLSFAIELGGPRWACTSQAGCVMTDKIVRTLQKQEQGVQYD